MRIMAAFISILSVFSCKSRDTSNGTLAATGSIAIPSNEMLSAIGSLHSGDPNFSNCTGSLVHKNTVITAAHCVLKHGVIFADMFFLPGVINSSIEIWEKANNSEFRRDQYGRYVLKSEYASKVHWVNKVQFVEATQMDPQHHYDDSDDIALLKLKDTPTVQAIEPLKLELNAERILSIFAQKQRLMLVGYPYDYHSGQRLIQLERYLGSIGAQLSHKCRKDSEEVMRPKLPFGLVNCRVTSGGNSGGPLIAMGPEDSRIIGIHTGGTTGEGTAVNLSFHKAFIESILGP